MPYIGKSPGNGVRQRYIYAATAGQTSFSGNDSAGISLAYDDPSYLDVYQNGVLLKPVTDYASTTGTSVVLVTGATTDDVIEMITYDTFAIADTVSAKDGGAFGGNVAVTGDITANNINATGCTLQVLQTPKTDTFTTSSTSFTDITGLSVNITPSSTSSKVLVFMDCKVASASNVTAFVRMVRDSTAIYVGDAASDRQRATMSNSDDPSSQFIFQMSGMFLDSPSTTSQVTYKVQILSEPSGNTGNVYVNRSDADTDNNQEGRYASSITVMEIAG
jgi:hypothetical protein